MALEMNEAQRLQALEAFDPSKHLVKIKSRDGQLKDYYPASWRLYELNLRYPDANFSTDVIYFDLDHDFAIVKARLYLGATYEESPKKTEALKQGKLSQLDKLDTACKARCARDWGVGTEYALEFSEEDEVPARSDEQEAALTAIKKSVNEAGLVRNPQQWTSWKKASLGQDVPDGKLTASHIARLQSRIDTIKVQSA